MRDVLDRVSAQIARHALLASGEPVTCLVSGGADSTCLWHVLQALGHPVRSVHVHHGVRGADADADADHCATLLGADVLHVPPEATEAALREVRYAVTAARGLRATGHTASDQVETVLLRLVANGTTRGIRPRRDDGVVRPLLTVWGEETRDYCRAAGLAWREDATNPDTRRGLVRERVLPLLEELDPRARGALLAAAEAPPELPRGVARRLAALLADRAGSASADLAGGVRAVREYDVLRLEGTVTWGPWRLSSALPDLVVRTRRPGDRLAGRRRKVQDLLVDAKVPHGQRAGWPIVAGPDGAVVAVPGIAVAPGFEDAVRAEREA